jgi:TRAP transporter TAXI family solute receptor
MKKFAIAAVALSAMLAGALFSGAAFAQKTIAIGTGGTGGVYYPLAGGLANLMSKNLKNVQATAQVTGGSVDNLKLIGAKQSELGFTMADAALDAEKGNGKFKGNPVDLRTLMVLYPNLMHVVTLEGKGIEKLSDLKGKRVSTGSGGSATEIMAFRIIEAAGLDKDKDMDRERLGASESANALKDGKIDAFFFVAGAPTSAIVNLGATPGVKIKMIDHQEVLEKMNAKYGGLYSAATIKAGTYPTQDKDNKATAVWNLMVTGDKMMTDQEAYDLVKLVFDHKKDLIAVHKAANEFEIDNQTKANSPLPWHPGAVKYFKEQGAKL